MNVKEAAEKWRISERSVRNYCNAGRIPGATLIGRSWNIPDLSEKPDRKQRAGKVSNRLLDRLKQEKAAGITGGIYHKTQIELTYNSNHMEGSQLTHDQTRYIFETNTIGLQDLPVKVDDVMETVNHFKCIDIIIDLAAYSLSESMIKQLHHQLKSGTSDSRKNWFAVGDYKRIDNEVGGRETTKVEHVPMEMKKLLKQYHHSKNKSLKDLIAFHVAFERIHPFQDGNGRIGRLILFKECLKNNITPFIIRDDMKYYYYRGLNEWQREPGYLMDTCLAAQDRFKTYMDYFGLGYGD